MSILQLKEVFVTVLSRPKTRLCIGREYSLHNAIQEWTIMACHQQSFVFLDFTECDAMKKEVLVLKKVQLQISNDLSAMAEK